MTKGQKIFNVFNYIFLGILAISCLFPLINVLAISFSSSAAISAGEVSLWPVDFNISAYKFILKKQMFLISFLNSIKRVAIGVPINMLLMTLCAYALSKPEHKFTARKYYIWYFIITILFNGGMIPWYLTIKATGLVNTIWALIIPSAVSVYNIILLTNFFRALPYEMEEAAYIDGATDWKVLWNIYLPNSLPAIATLTLFMIVFHWNEWFSGQILMSRLDKYPMQSYLRMILTATVDLQNLSDKEIEEIMLVNNRNYNAAQIFIATLPILCVYPMLQKYFVSGLTLGSVKG